MAWTPRIAGVEFGFPLIEKLERCGWVAGFVPEVVGNPAIGIHIKKMLAQTAGQEPSGNGKIFVMSAGEPLAINIGVCKGRGLRRNGIFSGKMAPDCVCSAHVRSS